MFRVLHLGCFRALVSLGCVGLRLLVCTKSTIDLHLLLLGTLPLIASVNDCRSMLDGALSPNF